MYNSPKLSNKQQKLLDKCQKLSNKSSNVVQQTANLLYNNQKLSNKLSNKSENCPTNCRQLYNKWQLSNKWEKLSNKIWKTVQQTPSVGQILSKMLYNKPDCWRSVVQQALERRETVQQISECLMSRPQGSGKGGGGAPYRRNVWGVPPTYRQRGWLQDEGGPPLSLKEIEGGLHFP